MSIAAAQQGPAFPTDWTTIRVEGAPYTHDPMHFPFPVSPLMASTSDAFARGYTAAANEYTLPIQEFQIWHANHYRFERILPMVPATEAEAAEQGALLETTMRREIERMIDRWFGEHRPRIVALQERLRELRPRGTSPREVLAMLDEAASIHRELWTIHFRIAFPMLLAMQLYREFHADVFGESGMDAENLMRGSVSESIAAGFGLADLARRARELGIADIVLTTPDDSLMAALAATEPGATFLHELDTYLEDYGLRQDLFDFMMPTWQEDPSFALSSVRNYLRTGHDPRADHAEIVASTDAAFDTARSILSLYPDAVRGQFEAMVQHARQGAFLQEEHNFHIDQRGLSLLRLFYRSVGLYLCELGLLDVPDDVFMLQDAEIRDIIERADMAGEGVRVRALVEERRGELDAAARMAPPPFLGSRDDSMPPPDTVVSRTMAAFFGGPPKPALEDGHLRGNPGSRGVATGPARVARTLEDAKSLVPGEILVALTTMPAWTPLFGVAAAVVTETGGVLSHCAIVAREYGIPAVVGAYGATTAIVTGQRITVDGERGIVTLSE